MKKVYLELAILGAIVPYVFFAPWFWNNGTDLFGFVSLLFANQPAGGFASDILISSAVFWAWSWNESRRHGVRYWWVYVVLNLTIGLSCALPLFLYSRLCRIEETESDTTDRTQAHTKSPMATATAGSPV